MTKAKCACGMVLKVAATIRRGTCSACHAMRDWWNRTTCACGVGPLPLRCRYCSACKRDKLNLKMRKRAARLRASGQCSDCPEPAMPDRRWCEKHSRKWAARNQEIKRIVMDMYGGKCACCGLANPLDCLTLDHIDNDGCEKRRSGEHGRGSNMYRRIKRDGFDPALQCYCWGCQLSKAISGVCVHQTRGVSEGDGAFI